MTTGRHSSSYLFLLFLSCGALQIAPQAHAQFTPEGYETAVGAGTYLDLTNDPAGTPRNGIKMIWSNPTAGAWGFPDTSDSSDFVNANSADDKGPNNLPAETPEIDLDFSGLLASTPYNIYLAARYRPAGNDEGGDISWGTMSGSLNLIQFSDVMFPPGSAQVDHDGDGDGTLLLKVGSLISDGSGALSFFVDNGLEFHQDLPDPPINPLSIGRDRTQFDGVLVAVVPEPLSIALGLIAACGTLLAASRRRTVGRRS